MAHKHGVPLIVDNTFATPINCRPFEWGCDIVTHSTTKYMDGHATQVGGCIVDSGNFDWKTCKHQPGSDFDTTAVEIVNCQLSTVNSPNHNSETRNLKPETASSLPGESRFPGLTTPDESYHGLTYVDAFGKMGYTTKLVAQLMRDLGSIPAPQNSFLLNLGLETLALRMKQHCSNAQKVAEWLEKCPKVAWVNYCGLPSSKYHALAQKYMPNGSCGVIAFGLKGTREDAIKFMDQLDFISIVTHVADVRTCVLHPASHTHRQMSDEQLREAGVAPDLIRLSVGIENADDIIADLQQAMEKM
jgi:O-acetylhomoserine (thiol)-lyase